MRIYRLNKNLSVLTIICLLGVCLLYTSIQQWIDLMDRPLEEFVQWRRSGSNGNEVPALTVPTEATSRDLIRRWEYLSLIHI